MASALHCFMGLRKAKFIGPRTYKQIHKTLKEIRTVFPGTKSWCIINSDGQVLMDGSDALGHEGKDMGNIVLKLRNVAQGVAEMYAQDRDEVNVVRVKGVHCMFSLYLAHDLTFAFYSEFGPNADVLNFDCTQQDEQIKAIIESIFQMISLKSSRRDSS